MTYRNKKEETFWTSLTFNWALKGKGSLNEEYSYTTQDNNTLS